MQWHKATIEVPTRGKGLYAFGDPIQEQLQEWNVKEGMCYLYCPHTSASLVISENYDPSARDDLAEFMERAVPESDTWYSHALEGPDDATSHIRAMLTDVSLTIPIDDGHLSLGTWQGVFLFEHRTRPQRRHVLLRVLSV